LPPYRPAVVAAAAAAAQGVRGRGRLREGRRWSGTGICWFWAGGGCGAAGGRGAAGSGQWWRGGGLVSGVGCWPWGWQRLLWELAGPVIPRRHRRAPTRRPSRSARAGASRRQGAVHRAARGRLLWGRRRPVVDRAWLVVGAGAGCCGGGGRSWIGRGWLWARAPVVVGAAAAGRGQGAAGCGRGRPLLWGRRRPVTDRARLVVRAGPVVVGSAATGRRRGGDGRRRPCCAVVRRGRGAGGCRG
jgi:hypothetical protein